MDTLIKVPVKPIVKQYIVTRFSDPYRATSKDVFGMIIPKYLTPVFADRYLGELPGQVNMNVQLPTSFKNHFLKHSEAKNLSLHIERLFWKDAKIEILTLLNESRNKSLAMRKFYDRYNIMDESYSQDNFYRQMTRHKFPSAELRLGEIKRPTFNCVSDHDAATIAGLHYKQKISFRQIANIFGIHHSTVSTICKKLKK